MRTAWFMHCHLGLNTLVGVLPAESGCYVRSFQGDAVDVMFYPKEPATRIARRIGIFKAEVGQELESLIDDAIEQDLKRGGMKLAA